MKKDTTHDIISRDQDTLSGTLVFKGTRVPIEALWDYLKAGDTLKEFLEDFPSVDRNHRASSKAYAGLK